MATTKVKKTKEVANGFAVMATGGKQYVVRVGDTLKIEKILGEHKEGDTLTFDKVLLTENAGDVKVGTPFLTGSKVTATLKEIGRNAKVTVIHYKQKSRYFKKYGHKQPFFKIAIDSIK